MHPLIAIINLIIENVLFNAYRFCIYDGRKFDYNVWKIISFLKQLFCPSCDMFGQIRFFRKTLFKMLSYVYFSWLQLNFVQISEGYLWY